MQHAHIVIESLPPIIVDSYAASPRIEDGPANESTADRDVPDTTGPR
jgi:hypothetical protein